MALFAVPMADSSGGGSGLALLLPLVLIVGMIWFMSRTQRKQRQRQAQTVAALAPGTRVVTTSGQVGTVEDVEDEYVLLEVADGVTVRFVKQAIGRVLDDDTAPAAGTSDDVEDVDAEDADDAELADDDTDVVKDDEVKDELPPTHREK
jgi:preprotein translocase subunit YajC